MEGDSFRNPNRVPNQKEESRVANSKPKLVVIMGATGSGKSRLAIDLASQFSIEIINADSMLVYQGLDVLTNKVPLHDQRGVPHHLLGTISPMVEFTAKDFRDYAIPLINDITSRNHLPVIVGGTNYYIQNSETLILSLPMEQKTSKKTAKKEAAKAKKPQRRQDAVAASAAASGVSVDSPDPLAANYGDIPIKDLQSKAVSGRVWTEVRSLKNELIDHTVLVRGQVQSIRALGKNIAFLTLRESWYTVQCVLMVAPDIVSAEMMKYATGISKESFVDIEGIVTFPSHAIKGASQKVELKVRKIFTVDRASSVLPISVEDAARSEVEIEKALEAGEPLVRVNQDTRLNYRILELRTPANQAIYHLECQVLNLFRQFLLNKRFVEIQTPKIIEGTSEGGAAVFELNYKGQAACLAQSPQLHKQMAICGGFQRLFVVGPVYRAEDSYTHRHLCEFTGLDVEMQIKEHYSEVMDIVDLLFVEMFDNLNQNCQEELEVIGKQYPFKPLKYLRNTLRLTFEEGIQMLKEAGVEVDPLGDLNTESERTLGKLVLDKYGTEFYILHRYPLAVRPFYTMPCADNETYSNSFDVFLRGEEISSGAQRVHVRRLLESRATALGIDVKTMASYMDSFGYGTTLHGGFGVGLERVVMLFCGLDNIRKTSLFPRDPRRLRP